MKFVIIGGGIAGLTQGKMLINQGHEVVICERAMNYNQAGHAILMNQAGIDILKSLDKNDSFRYHTIHRFSLTNELGEPLHQLDLDGWNCIKRSSFIQHLFETLPEGVVQFGKIFSHFMLNNQQIIAAVFLDGSVEYGDVFIGADGSNSMVRHVLFPEPKYTSIDICEIVGLTTFDSTGDPMHFRKIMHSEKGLSFGCIPVSNSEAVWFIQYDVRFNKLFQFNSSEELKAFCLQKADELNGLMSKLLLENDFEKTYVWKTRDFDVQKSFHHKNVVLIGDAAHLALPFTSTGTSNALLDAQTLTQCLKEFNTLEKAFVAYRNRRVDMLESHLKQGRELKATFLNQLERNDQMIPLAS